MGPTEIGNIPACGEPQKIILADVASAISSSMTQILEKTQSKLWCTVLPW
jgi:hypothetical protein